MPPTRHLPLPATQLRVARHTERLDEVVAFYRDGLGLIETGSFRDHAGYDGVFLALPGTNAHLELTAGGAQGAPVPHPESLLVLYLGDDHTVRTVAARLAVDPVPPANPYWAEHGLTFEDPDGFRVVLVPERGPRDAVPAAIRVEPYAGPRAKLRPLFELAEGSARRLDGYIETGEVLVATDGAEIVGHVQITGKDGACEAEINNIAVVPSMQRRGVGRALMTAAIELARQHRHSSLRVATAAADAGNLGFYQSLGFRMRSIERDAFTPAEGYEARAGAERDRVRLELLIDHSDNS